MIILLVGAGLCIVFVLMLVLYFTAPTDERKVQSKPVYPIESNLLYKFIDEPSEQEILRRIAWNSFQKSAPMDLPNYLAYRAQYHPQDLTLHTRLKNEHPKVIAFVVEPWGLGDAFPFGANYHIGIGSDTKRLNENESSPDQIVCTPDWNEQQTLLGLFYVKDDLLMLSVSRWVDSIWVFDDNGACTRAGSQ